MTKYNPIDLLSFKISGRESEDFICVFEKENSTLPLIVDCAGITYPTPQYSVNRNDSNFYVFEYLMEGKGHLVLNDKKILLEKGDFIFFKPHTKVSYRSDRNNPMFKYFIVFYCDLFDNLLPEMGINESGIIKNLNVQSEMLQIFEITKNCPYNDRIALKILSVLFQIVVKITAHLHSEKNNIDNTISANASALRKILDEHITKEFDIDQAAASLYRSRSTISRDFIKAFNITPYRYLLNKRIEVACSLLLNTNYTIKEISKMLVFSDPYYFSNLFKSKVGCSPATYRKQQNS